MTSEQLMEMYDLMLERFGPQGWWPGETPFEVAVGAVLTQNTSWANVEKAIGNLKAAGRLSAEGIHDLEREELAALIRPAGYFNVKAKRLKNLVDWLVENYGDMDGLEGLSTYQLREELLGVNGVGRETADSILLYALSREIFVVDAYTGRIASRHGLIDAEADYEQLRGLFESNLPTDVQLYNEYHALLVRVGNEFCKPRPKCERCPLVGLPHEIECQY